MTFSKVFTTGLLTLLFASPGFAESDKTGAEIYEQACKTCHEASKASGLGAPRAFNKEDWQPRLKRAELEVKQHPKEYSSVEGYLLEQVIKGRGLMHHGGLCKENPKLDCQDQMLIKAIRYISSEQKK